MIAPTPEPPYFAVIFSSQRSAGNRGYAAMAGRVERDHPMGTGRP